MTYSAHVGRPRERQGRSPAIRFALAGMLVAGSLWAEPTTRNDEPEHSRQGLRGLEPRLEPFAFYTASPRPGSRLTLTSLSAPFQPPRPFLAGFELALPRSPLHLALFGSRTWREPGIEVPLREQVGGKLLLASGGNWALGTSLSYETEAFNVGRAVVSGVLIEGAVAGSSLTLNGTYGFDPASEERFGAVSIAVLRPLAVSAPVC